MGFDMTVSHWMWHVDSLVTGAGIQLGQCIPIQNSSLFVLLCQYKCYKYSTCLHIILQCLMVLQICMVFLLTYSMITSISS